jgi:hypothetical protein
MKSLSKFLVLHAAAIVLLGLAGTASARSVMCESVGNDQRFCPADTRGGVWLSVQYSKASCRQGSSWGYDNRGIWVSNGCRAQFDLGDYRSSHSSSDESKAAAALAIGLIGAAAIASHHQRDDDDRGYVYQPYDHHAAYGPSDHVTCESRNNAYNFCRANLRHSGVDVERQLSSTTCRLGQNWGWSKDGIWVNGGCRAVFSVY